MCGAASPRWPTCSARYQVVRSRRLNVPAGHNHAAGAQLRTRRMDTTDAATPSPASTACRCTPTARALDAETLRQRACTELLRQAAMRAGLLAADDARRLDGAISEAATAAIEALLDARAGAARAVGRSLPAPPRRASPSATAPASACSVRHVLFAVTPGVDVAALRERAEAACSSARCHRDGEADRFAGAGGRAVQLPQRRRRAATSAG